MAIIVEDACGWDVSYTAVFGLYLKASEGVIGCNSDFLQRRLQTDDWTKGDRARVKSYLESLVKGNGTVDFFMIAPLDLVIQSLRYKLADTSLEEVEKENIQSVLNVVLIDQKNGMEFYVVDGQNRLFEALIPFFENQIPFGKEKIIILDEDAKGSKARIDLAKKYFKDLDPKIKTFLQEIEVPLAIATKGDIDSFTDALIAKNTNIAWSEWQRIRIKNSFTNYNILVNSVVEDKDKGLIAERLFSKLGSGYDYDKDGWEKFISEMLIWMNTKPNVQPDKSSNDGHIGYFEGRAECLVSKKSPIELKKYLREFAKSNFTKKNQHMMVRNYVMFRYAIDNPKRFPKINIPSWQINKGAEFASQFQLVCEALYNDPDAKEDYYLPDGTMKKRKKPNFFPWATSEYSKEFIECRLRLLFDYFIENKTEELVKRNTITVMDTTPMPTLGELYNEKNYDHKGNYITGLDLNRNKFHRGHKKPKRDGGKNTIDNLDFQNVESNLSYGKTEVTS